MVKKHLGKVIVHQVGPLNPCLSQWASPTAQSWSPSPLPGPALGTGTPDSQGLAHSAPGLGSLGLTLGTLWCPDPGAKGRRAVPSGQKAGMKTVEQPSHGS